MAQTEAEPNTLALLAALGLAAAGCGDLGDAQLPLPIHRGARDPAAPEFMPARFAAGPPQAVARISVGAGADEACPLELEALLPDASASQTLAVGAGPRAVDGDGVEIECRVLESPSLAGVFDVLLSLRRGSLWFRATGLLEPRGAAPGVLTWKLTLPDTTELSAACPVETKEVLNGAVWFHSRACQMPASDPVAGTCEVSFSAILENCRR